MKFDKLFVAILTANAVFWLGLAAFGVWTLVALMRHFGVI